uniref:Uncharacterized protein n=1 Tax=uncultured marine virus TaxID=186617 RepID=A0A0F7L3C6_9VIRU|nr:hypothetical protein [uncultured marine virus]
MEIKTINLKGKDYVQVHERIRFFRATPQYEGYGIITSYELGTNNIIFVARITNKEGITVSTGHGLGSLGPDKAVEKIETVAVGRALANMAIGVDEGIASIEEMVSFLNKQ